MGKWVYRTNTTLGIDPDWGTKAIPTGTVYRINIVPLKNKEWSFYILFPNIEEPIDEEQYDTVSLAQHLCETILEQGDSYEVLEIAEGEAENFNSSVPLLCYDPTSENEFIWLCPPENHRH